MEMRGEVQRIVEALHEYHGAALHDSNRSNCLARRRREWNRQHPLPDGNFRKDVIDEMCRRFPSFSARRSSDTSYDGGARKQRVGQMQSRRLESGGEADRSCPCQYRFGFMRQTDLSVLA
jgi:hypothetical protein